MYRCGRVNRKWRQGRQDLFLPADRLSVGGHRNTNSTTSERKNEQQAHHLVFKRAVIGYPDEKRGETVNKPPKRGSFSSVKRRASATKRQELWISWMPSPRPCRPFHPYLGRGNTVSRFQYSHFGTVLPRSNISDHRLSSFLGAPVKDETARN
jgi:hypothetical protein